MPATSIFNIPGGSPQSVATGETGIAFDTTNNTIKCLKNGTTLYEFASVAVQPLTSTGNLTLTAALHAARTVIHNETAGRTYTLPAATGTGNKYRIVVGVTLGSGSLVVQVASNTDYMRGRALLQNDTDGSASNFETANTGTVATESDIATFNRSTTGLGTIGDELVFEDIATAIWLVKIEAQASGAEATPFSVGV